MRELSEAIEICTKKNLAFALFRYPEKDGFYLIIQKTGVNHFNEINDLSDKKGFVVSPFNLTDENRGYHIQSDLFFIDNISSDDLKLINDLQGNTADPETELPTEIDFDAYKNQLNEYFKSFKGNKIKKAILSRVINVKRNRSQNLFNLFIDLSNNYKHAFIYLTNIPGAGTWMGATPELLINKEKEKIKTVALAGTLLAEDLKSKKANWSQKEIDEQAFVSAFIRNVLEQKLIIDIEESGPSTHYAGNVGHLKTKFQFNFNNNWTDLVGALHPTPAVCGLPRNDSFNLINEVESHNREFYSGIVGHIGSKDYLNLYVNLRCMKVSSNHYSLFIGGGITPMSNPELEWKETQNKANTLLKFLNI